MQQQHRPGFDFDASHYSIPEMLQIFQIAPHEKQNAELVEQRSAQLHNRILNQHPDMTDPMRQSTIQFISRAKNILLQSIRTMDSLKPIQLNANSAEHMVQERMDKPYLASFPSEYFKGVINPLKKRTVKRNLNIDSRFRSNYSTTQSTNFNLILPMMFDNVLQMQLASIELPLTYFVVSHQLGNSVFYVQTDTSGQSVPSAQMIPVTIPNGNYTNQTIIDAINGALTDLSLSLTFELLLNENATTGTGQTKITSTSTSSASNYVIRFELNEPPKLSQRLGWMLGFRENVYALSNSDSICLEGLVSEGLVDTNGPKYLFLVVDDHNNSVNNNFYSAFSESFLNQNILARISVKSPPFGTVNQDSMNLISTPREYFGPVNLTNMNIQLIDEYGRIVNLHQMDFSICLTLTMQYDIS